MSQSILVTNMLLDEHGSLRTRDGTLILTTSPDVAPNIRPIVKLYDFINQAGTIVQLAIVQGTTGNNQLYDRGTTPWTLIGTLGTKYATPDLLTFTNVALLANGYEIPYQFDGITLQHLTASSGTVPKGANHHTLHQGFYWVWNTAPGSDTSDGPSSLRSSDLNNPNSWPLANQLFIDKDDGDAGQGMGQFTIAESGISPSTSQVLFKQFKGFQMTGVFGSTNPAFAVQKIKSDMGCIAPRSISFAPGFGLIRMTHRGFALFDGVDDRLISEEVRPLIFGSPIYEAVDWAAMGTAYAVTVPNPPLYVCAVPVCGIAGLTRLFCYDLVRKAWSILQYANPIATLQIIEDPVGPADTTGRGQVWNVDAYDNTGNQVGDMAPVVFTGDLSALRFHRGGADGYAFVYDKSSDGGATWPTTVVTAINNFAAWGAAGSPTIQSAAVVTAQVPNVYLILGRNNPGVLRSTDLNAWTLTVLPGAALSPPTSMLVRGTAVAVTGSNVANDNLFWISTDAGATFAAAVAKDLTLGPPGNSEQLIASPADNIWLWIGKTNIWRSTDNGLTFTGVLTYSAGSVNGYAILCPNDHQVVLCVKGQIYTSDDAGLTWTLRQNLSAQNGSISAFGYYGGSVLGAMSLQLGTFDKTTTAAAAWRSIDYGRTWTSVVVNGGFGTVAAGFAPADSVPSFVTRGGRAIASAQRLSAAGPDNTHNETWSNPSTGGGAIIPAGVCPAAPANVLMGDYSGGHVRQSFAGDATDDSTPISWQALMRAVSFGSPQTNAYYRRVIVKVTDVVSTQVILTQFIFGPVTSVPPRLLTKTLTIPVDVGLGLGFGIQPFGTSPFGGVQWNSEVDLTVDLGLIATNARGILSGTGKIRVRGLEWHGKAKPLRRASVFT